MKELLSESSEVSCIRVMALLSLLFGFIVAVIGLFLYKELNQISILSGVFIGPAFGAKVMQKKYEVEK